MTIYLNLYANLKCSDIKILFELRMYACLYNEVILVRTYIYLHLYTFTVRTHCIEATDLILYEREREDANHLVMKEHL